MAAVTHVRRHIGPRAQRGETPLIFAAERGHAECTRLLLDAGADKEATGYVRASVVVVLRGVG